MSVGVLGGKTVTTHVVYVKVEFGSAHVAALSVASNAFHPMHMHTFHPSLSLSRYSL